MSTEDLRDLLSQLHARLARTTSLDADARALLKTVSGDIEKTLSRGAETGAPPVARLDALEALEARFEADHPALANVLRQIIDTLGKAGV